jgi:O-antigen biosynthesis protein WbqP
MALIAPAIKLTSRGPVLYWSDRVGRNNRIFRMPKFRSMRTDTPQLATHLLRNPDAYLTPIGKLLRLSSLDELPQLFSVLRGHLSLVGPRPRPF